MKETMFRTTVMCRKRFTFRSVAVLMALSVYMGIASVEASDQTGAANPVVAVVNDSAIHRDLLDRELALLAKKYKISSTKFASKDAEQRQNRNIIDKLITVELFRQAVHSISVPDADKRVEEKLAETKSGFSNEEEFLQYLNKSGKTAESFKAELRETILVDEYMKRNQLKDIPVSEEEMERYYRQNTKQFIIPEQIKARHILIKLDSNPAPDAVERALKKAREIREQIVAGKSFSDMAREHSECSSASEGGDLGFIPRGYMPADFDAVAFSLKSGEVSEPLRTRFGYHIIETLERKPESVRPLGEVKDFIRKHLGGIKEQQRMAAHIEELKKKANIKLFLD